jgi:hypothetical protein
MGPALEEVAVHSQPFAVAPDKAAAEATEAAERIDRN